MFVDFVDAIKLRDSCLTKLECVWSRSPQLQRVRCGPSRNKCSRIGSVVRLAGLLRFPLVVIGSVPHWAGAQWGSVRPRVVVRRWMGLGLYLLGRQWDLASGRGRRGKSFKVNLCFLRPLPLASILGTGNSAAMQMQATTNTRNHIREG
jgi:hypothetical protein